MLVVMDTGKKTIVITGAASGIGRLMALEFARRGHRIAVLDIDASALPALKEDLRRAGAPGVHCEHCDVSKPDAVRSAALAVRDALGPADILINNAAVVAGKRILDLSDAEIQRTFSVNTLALYWTTRAFLPEMIERRRGQIVTIASASGYMGMARLTDYSASKWAAVGFDESLRLELRTTCAEIRTTVICPYFIDTGMFDGARSRLSFILPFLKEDKVAKASVAAILRGDARLVMPWMVHLAPLARALLPVAWMDQCADWVGIPTAMDTFHGRQSNTTTTAANQDQANDSATREARAS